MRSGGFRLGTTRGRWTTAIEGHWQDGVRRKPVRVRGFSTARSERGLRERGVQNGPCGSRLELERG